MNRQTDINPEQHLQEILVNLTNEHTHLKATIDHLEKEIVKRELKVKKLLADKQVGKLKIPRSNSEDFNQLPVGQTGQVFSSEFSKQAAKWTNVISKNAEEISALSKL